MKVQIISSNSLDLARVHRLMARIEHGLVPVAHILQDHISKLGNDLVKRHTELAIQQKEYTKFVKHLMDNYVPELLQLHETLVVLITRAFDNSLVFQKCVVERMKTFVNEPFKKPNSKHEVRPAQLFAFYCDEVLRKKDERLEEKLDKIVKFIQFFRDKDVFVEEYRKQLAKRLLVSEYQEMEERNMISKLKV